MSAAEEYEAGAAGAAAAGAAAAGAAAAADGFAAMPDAELLVAWDRETDFRRRDELLKALLERNLFPADYVKGWETSTGAYPSQEDPEFLQKLLAKREFAESLQRTWMPTGDPCSSSGGEFEVTPVQRFAANLMSPRSPYMSALLFHGVGVGKTCAGVQIMEAWLNAYPREKVFLVAPPTIQGGFYKTIFDMNRVTIPAEEGAPNTATGCTGSTYLELTGMLLERKPEIIERRVAQAIRRRYNVFGYMAFANYIKKLIGGLPATLSDKDRRIQERKIIRREFDGKLLVIDEAHNLRDVEGDIFDKEDAPGGRADADDEASGKVLTPYLRKVLRYAEGLKLVLMTATPMYNNHREIVFMMNLIMMNEKKATYRESMIFDEKGALKPTGAAAVGYFGSRYVSYMRGENPKTFPLRLFPAAAKRSLADYPSRDPRRAKVPADAGLYMEKLPIVSIPLKGECLRASVAFMDALPRGEGGVSSMQLSSLVRAGNFVPPPRAMADDSDSSSGSSSGSSNINNITSNTQTGGGSSSDESNEVSEIDSSSDESIAAAAAGGGDLALYRQRMEDGGLGIHFDRKGIDVGERKEVQFQLKKGATARWLGEDQLGTYAPKFEFLLDRLKTCRGVGFVYTRFVESGALPLALALEANGYKPWGRRRPLLEAGPQTAGGGQCALCALRERNHGATADHPFTQAYYGLLTGDIKLSPDNQATIRAEQDRDNKEGSKMKVIIGSQIASEGVDLRYIRETHVLDSWFHLNKTEQIIGRSIRFCSHSALPANQRNVTVYLYANKYPEPWNTLETADEYSYRIAFQKARYVGAVTRTLKIHAIDCNLNHDAIVVANQPLLEQIDSQGTLRRTVSINDVPYTAICDWLDTCDYSCKPQIRVNAATADDSTYSEFAAKWRESKLRTRLRAIFKEQSFFDAGTMVEQFADVPAAARSELFSRTIGNKLFEVEHAGLTGYIIYRNGYFVFQPFAYADVHIPLSIRSAKFPVRRDAFEPASFVEEAAPLAVAMPRGGEEERRDDEEGTSEEAVAEGVEAIWEELVAWVDALVSTTKPVSVPSALLTYLGSHIGRDSESTKKINDILAMIQWVQYGFVVSGRERTRATTGAGGAGAAAAPTGTVFREIRPEFVRGFRYALLGYLFDNWFSVDAQKTLLVALKGEKDVQALLGEGVFRFDDGRIVYRLYNPAKDDVLFVTSDGAPAGPAITKYIEGESGKKLDPMGGLVVSAETTHDPYGFLTAKAGRVIFKTSELPKKGKVMKGKECAIVSNMPLKRELMKMMGSALKEAGLPDLELRPEVYLDERPVSGSTRACVLIELALRFLDTMKVKNVRWFYRGVQAKKVGHVA
jgi:hypothetical protein